MNELVNRHTVTRGIVIVALLLVALFVFPAWLGGDWINTLTSVAIYSVVAAGLVVLYGKVGMISLGQIALLGARHLGRDPAELPRRPPVPAADARHGRRSRAWSAC